MDLLNIIFFIALAFWVVAILMLVPVQLKMMSKHGGMFSASFKSLDSKQLKIAKLSGILFLIGVAILISGFILK